jgi:glycosyltransferase involved in cell wall biosynthesis
VQEPDGVSFVIPVKDGERWLNEVLQPILAERERHRLEIILVDDGSSDASMAVVAPLAANGTVVLLKGEHRGAASAINLGMRHARYPLIAQIDQDVRIAPDWLPRMLVEMRDGTVAGTQGHYVAAAGAGIWARVMGLDLRQRYSRLGHFVNHICTGNTVYRAEALARVGFFDETLGYGYDNDLSYRLDDAGYRLVLCKEARAVHYWDDNLLGYLSAQYGMGYGRIDLVNKHHNRYNGDEVSNWLMMAHAPLMLLAFVALIGATLLTALGARLPFLSLAGVAILAALATERALAGIVASRRFGDRAGLMFPVAHLLRDLAWSAAIVAWVVRRALRIRAQPGHSMPR